MRRKGKPLEHDLGLLWHQRSGAAMWRDRDGLFQRIEVERKLKDAVGRAVNAALWSCCVALGEADDAQG